MKLRITILLLAGVLLVLCGASSPQPATENPKDARKLRYEDRKQLVNEQKAASEKGSTSDPNAPLSLLPAGEEAPKGDDLPNQAPETKDLRNGVTAAASLDNAPEDSGTENSSVRSLAIDGAPYGEVRKVIKQPVAPLTPVKTPQVLATSTPAKKPAQAPPTIADAGKVNKPAAKPPVIAKPPSTPKDQKLLAANTAPKQATPAVPKLKPVATAKPKATPEDSGSSLLKGETNAELDEPATSDSGTAAATQSTEDRWQWLDEHIKGDSVATDRTTDEVRHDDTPVLAGSDQPLEASGGELLDSKPGLGDSELDSLGIPGTIVAKGPSRLRGWLFGLCGLFALGAVLVALPRPRPLAGKAADGLTLIETIGLAEGRELVILRKKHYALVLGVTRNATHLLEKVSMASLDSDYHSVINAIIKRESEAPELWRMRPLFSGSYRTEHAPEERAAPARVTSLAELRAGLQVVGPSRAATTPAVRASMSELRQRSDVPSVTARRMPSLVTSNPERDAVIRRIREQARRAS